MPPHQSRIARQPWLPPFNLLKAACTPGCGDPPPPEQPKPTVCEPQICRTSGNFRRDALPYQGAAHELKPNRGDFEFMIIASVAPAVAFRADISPAMRPNGDHSRFLIWFTVDLA